MIKNKETEDKSELKESFKCAFTRLRAYPEGEVSIKFASRKSPLPFWVSSKPGKSALKTFLLHQVLHCI